jgi:hypothetical protein
VRFVRNLLHCFVGIRVELPSLKEQRFVKHVQRLSTAASHVFWIWTLVSLSVFNNEELPTKVRDSILNIKQVIPKSEVNKQFFSQNIESKVIWENIYHSSYQPTSPF